MGINNKIWIWDGTIGSYCDINNLEVAGQMSGSPIFVTPLFQDCRQFFFPFWVSRSAEKWGHLPSQRMGESYLDRCLASWESSALACALPSPAPPRPRPRKFAGSLRSAEDRELIPGSRKYCTLSRPVRYPALFYLNKHSPSWAILTHRWTFRSHRRQNRPEQMESPGYLQTGSSIFKGLFRRMLAGMVFSISSSTL